MAIRLMICFARSGGSLLNQCLGSLDNVVMLSEVNPLGGGWGVLGPDSYTTPFEQAKNWYGITLDSQEFLPSVIQLHSLCEEQGKYLIVRDWSFVNFVPYTDNEFNPPKKFLTYELLQFSSEVIPFAFTRDVIDIWISMGMPDPDPFFNHYLDYVKKIQKLEFKIFRYEDFCKNPEQILKQICQYLGIPFSLAYKNFNNFHQLNGDVQLKGENASRGKQDREIKLLPRKVIPEEKVRVVNSSRAMKEANEIMGYPQYYGSESLIHKLRNKLLKA
jgi:hypothetical protein